MVNPTAYINVASAEARAAERGTEGEEFKGGMNLGGSNSMGIGINVNGGVLDLSSWSLLDQHGDARTPQNSQHIGGSGLAAGTEGATGSPIYSGQPAPNGRLSVNGEAELSDLATGWEASTVVYEHELTVGSGGGNFGYELGTIGGFDPVLHNGVEIDGFGATAAGVVVITTIANAPLYGTENIIVTVEGSPSGAYEVVALAPGLGFYQSVIPELADYIIAQDGNALGVDIVSA